MPKLLGITRSASDPSARFRFVQFVPYFKQAGWEVVHWPQSTDFIKAMSSRQLPRRLVSLLRVVNLWQIVQQVHRYDVVFMNRSMSYGHRFFFEQQLLRRNPRIIFDYDDMIFAGSTAPSVRWLCQYAAWNTPGNAYLAEIARQYTPHMTIIPTVIDVDTYTKRNYTDTTSRKNRVRVGWSGSDLSIKSSLFPYIPMFAQFQKELGFDFVIITNTKPTLPTNDLHWEFIPWKPAIEGQLSDFMDVGVMPLVDDKFQRGKCGLKLLQYMAAGIPTIGSPVGVNQDIVLHGTTGFLADEQDEWFTALKALTTSTDLLPEMGQAGRNRCEQYYSIRRWFPELLNTMECVRANKIVSESAYEQR